MAASNQNKKKSLPPEIIVVMVCATARETDLNNATVCQKPTAPSYGVWPERCILSLFLVITVKGVLLHYLSRPFLVIKIKKN